MSKWKDKKKARAKARAELLARLSSKGTYVTGGKTPPKKKTKEERKTAQKNAKVQRKETSRSKNEEMSKLSEGRQKKALRQANKATESGNEKKATRKLNKANKIQKERETRNKAYEKYKDTKQDFISEREARLYRNDLMATRNDPEARAKVETSDTAKRIAELQARNEAMHPFASGVASTLTLVSPHDIAESKTAYDVGDMAGSKAYGAGQVAGLIGQAVATSPFTAGGNVLGVGLRRGAKEFAKRGGKTALVDAQGNISTGVRRAKSNIEFSKSDEEAKEVGKQGRYLEENVEPGGNDSTLFKQKRISKWNEDIMKQVTQKYGDANNVEWGTDNNGMLHYSANGNLDDILSYYNNAEKPTYTLDGNNYSKALDTVAEVAKGTGISFGTGGVFAGVSKSKNLAEDVIEDTTRNADNVVENVTRTVDETPSVKVEETVEPIKKNVYKPIGEKTTSSTSKKATMQNKTTKQYKVKAYNPETKKHEVVTVAAKDELEASEKIWNMGYKITDKNAFKKAEIEEKTFPVKTVSRNGNEEVIKTVRIPADTYEEAVKIAKEKGYGIAPAKRLKREGYDTKGRGMGSKPTEIDRTNVEVKRDADGKVLRDEKGNVMVSIRNTADKTDDAIKTEVETPIVKSADTTTSKVEDTVTPKAKETPSEVKTEATSKSLKSASNPNKAIVNAESRIAKVEQMKVGDTVRTSDVSITRTGKNSYEVDGTPQYSLEDVKEYLSNSTYDRSGVKSLKTRKDKYNGRLQSKENKVNNNKEVKVQGKVQDKEERLLQVEENSKLPETGVGATKADEPIADAKAEIKKLNEEHGVIREESPNLTPNKTKYGATSQAGDTVRNAEMTEVHPNIKPYLDEGLLDGEYAKYIVSNTKGMEKARKAVTDDLDTEYSRFKTIIEDDKRVRHKDIMRGIALMEEFAKKNDADKFKYVTSSMVGMLSETGQMLQAARIFNRLKPEAKADYALSLIKKFEKKHGVTYDMESAELKGLIKAVRNAKTKAEIETANEKLAIYLWNGVPPTFREKLDAYRYLSMLGNPKTHIRNILGNAIMYPVRQTAETLSVGFEKAFGSKFDRLGALEFAENLPKDTIVKINGKEIKALEDGKYLVDGKEVKFDYIENLVGKDKVNIQKLNKDKEFEDVVINNRTKTNKKASEEVKEFSEKAWKDNYKEILKQTKYFETVRPNESPVFKAKWLQKLYNLNSGALNKEDLFFSGSFFKREIRKYMTARNLTPADMVGKTYDDTIEYASRRSLEATYREANAVADWVNDVRKNLLTKSEKTGVNVAKTVGVLALDSTIPFVKTPMNILKQGAKQYSPIGVIQGAIRINKAKSSIELARAIEQMTEGLTGTAIMGLGAFLYSKGFIDIKAEGGKDKDYKNMLGVQDYSFKGKNGSYTIDWIAPQSMMFLTGCSLADVYMNKNGDSDEALNNFYSCLSALAGATQPVTELSMLSGINNVFGQMMTGTDRSVAGQLLENATTNYIMQFIPTLSGQIARTVSNERTISVATKGGTMQRQLNKTTDKALNKIPWASRTNQPYVDSWGRTENNGSDNFFLRFLYNAVSPGYYKKMKNSPVDDEILRLYDATKNSDVLPVVGSSWNKQYQQNVKADSGDAKELVLSEDDLTRFKKIRGQKQYADLEKLFKKDKYKTASDVNKAKMISEVYADAREYAREKVLVGDYVTKNEYAYSTLSTTKREVVDKYNVSASKLRTVSDKMSKYEIASNSPITTMAYTEKGLKKKALRELAQGTRTDENQTNLETASKKCIRLGISSTDLAKVKAKVKGEKKDDLVNAINNAYSSSEKRRAVFSVLAHSNWKNPY